MRWISRLLLVGGALAGVLAVTLAAGLRQGLLTLLGIGFGAVLQGARFGFTTGWRDFIERRDPQGLWAQMLLMVLAAETAKLGLIFLDMRRAIDDIRKVL